MIPRDAAQSMAAQAASGIVRAIRSLADMADVSLAGASAISASDMRVLREVHGQDGWHASHSLRPPRQASAMDADADRRRGKDRAQYAEPPEGDTHIPQHQPSLSVAMATALRFADLAQRPMAKNDRNNKRRPQTAESDEPADERADRERISPPGTVTKEQAMDQ